MGNSNPQRQVTNLLNQILELMNDELFYKLQNHNPQNIFDILKIQGKEEPISSILAWILDPRASHNMGDSFLVRFIQDSFKGNPTLMTHLLKFELNSTIVATEFVLPSGRRIDIIIRDSKNNIAIGIENKVYSSENNEQTLEYERDFQKLFSSGHYGLVYLALDEHDYPQSSKFMRVTHDHFSRSILDILKITESIDDQTRLFIEQYVRSVRKSMGTTEEQELCKILYQRYPKAVTLLAKTVSNMLNDLPEKVLGKIANLIKEDNKFICTGGKSWLAVYPEEWIGQFGHDNWSPVHHEFYCNETTLYLTFHVEGKEFNKVIERRYKDIAISSFTVDNIEETARKGYEELHKKHSEIFPYIKGFYKSPGT